MLNGRTFYQILGVQPDAEDVVIKAAYRALSQRYHPDKWAGDPKVGSDRMIELNRAYAVLSDAVQRQRYDDELSSSGEESVLSEDMNVEEILREVLSEQDLAWEVATDYLPRLGDYLASLKKINSGLAFTNKAILVNTRQYDQAEGLYKRLRSAFLRRYFGTDETVLRNVEGYLAAGRKDILLEINKAVRVLGTSVSGDQIIKRIRSKFSNDYHGLTPEIRDAVREVKATADLHACIKLLEWLDYVVEETSSGIFSKKYSVSKKQVVVKQNLSTDQLTSWVRYILIPNELTP